MASLGNEIGGSTTIAHRPPAARATVPVEAGEVAARDASAGAGSAPAERERAFLADRLHRRHPEVPPPVIARLVDQEHAALGPSRVQRFRLVLTERAVRRRLRSLGSAGPAEPTAVAPPAPTPHTGSDRTERSEDP